MTFEDRVNALLPLGLTQRQTRFLVTVALHGGFCLRRQYATFAGIEYGKHVRDFLDTLMTRELARRIVYKSNRGFLYHVYAKAVYRAIAQEDNRNRRIASPALVARKVMLLDAVIATRGVEWFATENDKVELFSRHFNVHAAALPHRRYASTESDGPDTVRAFVHKLPIYLPCDSNVPHFVCLADGVGDGGCEAFLRDHARLLVSLDSWVLVAIGPEGRCDFAAAERAFKRFCDGGSNAPALDTAELGWYCRTRKAVERNQLDCVSVSELGKFRDVRRRLEPTLIDGIYEEWLAAGDAVFERCHSRNRHCPNARFEARALPYRYTQFGDLPGVC